MKKKLLFLVSCSLLFSSHLAKAQIINPGFETWTADALVPTAMDPNTGNGSTGWWDFNLYNSSAVGSSPVSVTRCTDTVHSGTYSARIESKVYTPTSWGIYNGFGTPFIGHPYNDTLGILFNGNVNIAPASYTPGIPCTVKLTQYKFWYQYRPHGNDTAECRVALLSNGTLVAGGVFKTNVPTGAAGWQQATINFTYISSLTPDTLYVLYSAASLDMSPKANSVLWIDDVTVTSPTGVEQLVGEENSIEIFPNPATSKITLLMDGNSSATIILNDVLGNELKKIVTKDNKVEFETDDLPDGIYFITVNRNGNSVTKKVVVNK